MKKFFCKTVVFRQKKSNLNLFGLELRWFKLFFVDKESSRVSFKIENNEYENKRNWSLNGKNLQHSNSVRIKESRKQIIQMLLVIVLAFTVCWCPRFLCKFEELKKDFL